MAEEGGGGGGGKKKIRYVPASSVLQAICCGLLILIVILGIIALVLYLVYRPSKPRVTVIGAAVYDLNASSPNAPTVSTSMQFTLAIRNPSGRASIFYDQLTAFVVYRGQAITPIVMLPPLYQEKDSTVVASAVVGGGVPVPVSAEVVTGLEADESYGLVPVRLAVTGRVKYKTGPFRSPWVRVFVRCDLLVGVKKGKYGQVPLLGSADCSVST